jgi:hypothetical protein
MKMTMKKPTWPMIAILFLMICFLVQHRGVFMPQNFRVGPGADVVREDAKLVTGDDPKTSDGNKAATAAIPTANPAQAESLNETLDWMSNTLKPAERNNYYVHRTYSNRSKEEIENGVDPRVMERITRFSHNSCSVTVETYFETDDTVIPGQCHRENDTLLFDLGDIDPQTISIEDSCKPLAPGWGAPSNCGEMQGTQVNFKTRDAKPNIHVESIASGGKTMSCSRKNSDAIDEVCRKDPGNCGVFRDAKETKDETADTLGFSTPRYAERFASALRHAVILCGGKASTF